MNRNDDFDRTLEAWLHRQAPPQAPDRVLDTALERVDAESQRRGWLQRLSGGTTMTIMIRTAAVAAVVAIAVLIGLQFSNLTDNNVGDTSPSPIPSASAQPSESAAPSSSLSTVEPSAEPSAAALVLRLMSGTEAGRVHAVTVLDDGRVITSDPFGIAAPTERSLTEFGIQLVRDELDATGLTGTSADYNPVPNPGAEPPGYGGAGPSLEVGQTDGETVVITWFLFGDTEQDYFQPQPEAEALQALYGRLTTLEEWLPESAWADAEPAPYLSSTYLLYVITDLWGGSLDDLPIESSTVAWPLDVGIDSFGTDLLGEGSEPQVRCGVVTADEGAAVAEALESAGATPSEQRQRAYSLGDRAVPSLITINLVPILPLDEGGCEGAGLPQ